MVVRQRRKIIKMRGRKRTYGWGSSKKHRGKGSKGGKGKAGIMGKKSQARIQMAINKGIARGPPPGFKRAFAKRLESVRTMNVGAVEEMLPKWLDAGVAVKTKEKGKVEIDLTKLGVDKLLGGGDIKTPVVIKARAFSESAKRKLVEAGGEAQAAL